MRACLLVSLLCLSSACATMMRGSSRQINILGPEGLQADIAGTPVVLANKGTERDGQTRYVGTIDKTTAKLNLHAGGKTVEATLDTRPGVGWIILDSILLVPLAIDGPTRAWSDFKEVDWLEITSPSSETAAAQEPELMGPQRPPPQQASPPQRTTASATPPPQAMTAPQAMAGRHALLDKGKLAVLDFQNFAKDLSKEDVHYFADVVRGATLRAAPRMDVMTRENLLVLLQASGKDASACEGECEVDTGRRIGADAVISGEVLKVGSRYKISLKLHETHDGRLLSTGVASGKSIDDLDEKLQAAAAELLAPR
jgi:TolB-like protein